MHELSVTMAIMSIVLEKAQEAGAARVTGVDLRVGRLAGIIPECVRLQFSLLGKGTIAEGASLSFIEPPLTLRCRVCDITYTRDNTELTCPNCEGREIDIVTGFELSVESIEVD
jgi:hydrogenase nickel incorporation protein HypA/HybF